MRIIAKSFIYALISIKDQKRQILPLIIFLLLIDIIFVITNFIPILFIEILLYIYLSAPLTVTICRNLINKTSSENELYFNLFASDYLKLYIKKFLILFLLLFSIYFVVAIVISPFLSNIIETSSLLYIGWFFILMLTYFYLRLFLVLAAASINIDLNFIESFKQTGPFSIQTFFQFLCLFVPYLITAFSIAYVFQDPKYFFILSILTCILQIFGTIVHSAFLGLKYDELVKRK